MPDQGNKFSTKDEPPKLPEWVKKGVNDAFSDTLKTALLPVLIVLSCALASSLLYLNSVVFKIEFEIPAYLWATSVLISILIFYFNKTKIDRFLRQIKVHQLYGVAWRINRARQVVGPLCPKCKSFLIQTVEHYHQQLGIAFGMMQGVERLYAYCCSNTRCLFTHESKLSLEQLIERAQVELEP
jgi:hypothetical protein